jgi:NDP-sugar pyrophosphorylase family protein
MRRDLKDLHIVLQAGGKGERLRNGAPLPKPLFTVDGMPMIERLLRQLAAAGARSVIVITGFGADQVEAAVGSIAGLPKDLQLSFLRETAPRGNAGALALAPRSRPCLFCFADLVTSMDFGRFAGIHFERRAAATLASHYESIQVRLGELTAAGNRVIAYREKPLHPVLIASGIAIFDPSVLELIPRDRPSGLSDVVQAAIDRGLVVRHWLHEAPWMDVNTPEDLESARLWAAGAPRVA